MARWVIFLLLTAAVCHSDGARILGLFPIAFRSHMISYTALLEELVKRGHQVTVVSPYPRETPLANYTDVVTDMTIRTENMPNVFETEVSLGMVMQIVKNMSVVLCEEVLKQPDIQKLIEEKELQFDLIIFEIFFNECFYGFVHKYRAPVIHISSNTISLIFGDGVGNPHTSSYIPNVLQGTSSNMTFTDRLINTVTNFVAVAFREYIVYPSHDEIIQRYFKDRTVPHVREMERNASILFINVHSSINFPRPLTPNTIEVGGMHIRPGKKLPKDIQKFMDEAPHGVVYFGMGSVLPCKFIPLKLRRAIVDAFSKLKQRVLWKWDAEDIPGLPPNVKTAKWMPQKEILAHPNIRAFITHSGLLSIQEATYYGVPMIAIAGGGDQVLNADAIWRKGYAVLLKFTNLTTDSLSWALEEVLNNPRYKENAKRVSTIFRDQPMSPLETAVYWTEYVIRHKGAPHLRSAALDLWWFQYYLLDVLTVLLGVAILCTVALWVTCRTLYRLVAVKKNEKQTKKHNQAKKTN